MILAEKIIKFYTNLNTPSHLPENVEVMNPYQNGDSLEVAGAFYKKYYSDNNERTVLFGINPGRFGGGVTGVPFTDPEKLETYCGISNPFDKKQELSSKFIYDMIIAYGGPELFYSKYYISAISPLGFVKDGKNLNYYDIKEFKELITHYALDTIKAQMAFPLSTKVAYCIGQGQNLKFLELLNQEGNFFDEIITVPHPRWVMQYRLKRKAEFIREYLDKLD
ncbi:uracil-DNA glycosylase family protein [Marinoscillum sp. MHG1-6]|uniref:uracil-DNA glycosylase family protein n=1 Tax=Marinoscillum sp. MHG1-6 TaxID=2959627 RepID=UPI00215819EC|nr:uracil-DNA glycosylase family protein [Marinoscillum sp. MHG1-6]